MIENEPLLIQISWTVTFVSPLCRNVMKQAEKANKDRLRDFPPRQILFTLRLQCGL